MDGLLLRHLLDEGRQVQQVSDLEVQLVVISSRNSCAVLNVSPSVLVSVLIYTLYVYTSQCDLFKRINCIALPIIISKTQS